MLSADKRRVNPGDVISQEFEIIIGLEGSGI